MKGTHDAQLDHRIRSGAPPSPPPRPLWEAGLLQFLAGGVLPSMAEPPCGQDPLSWLCCVTSGSSQTLSGPVSLPAERLRGPTKILDLRKMESALREPHTRISLLLRVTSHVRDPLAPPIPQATDQEGSLCPQSVPLAISSYPQGKLWPGDRAWSPEETQNSRVAWGGPAS